MTIPTSLPADEFVSCLTREEAYPHPVDDPVRVVETHISWIFLAGEFAYKVKKPLRNHFLDYTTLERRHGYCREELRLNRRYAPDIYLDVVPITLLGNSPRVGGDGEPFEYAVRMRRFADGRLLGDFLDRGEDLGRRGGEDSSELPPMPIDLRDFATQLAEFHAAAEPAPPDARFATPEVVLASSLGNFTDLAAADVAGTQRLRESLEAWTRGAFSALEPAIAQRQASGHVRECHGDLHCDNIVWWRGAWTPFDGVEFKDDFRWIDTISDVAFTIMDVAARGHEALHNELLNDYLEASGDYDALPVLRWYLVYRALVRAKVAALRTRQLPAASREADEAAIKAIRLMELADGWARHDARPMLWITHGLSGSGKSTGARSWVRRTGALQLRSDVQRKALAGLRPLDRSEGLAADALYSADMGRATYEHLATLAQRIVSAGYSVIVDAAFLQRWQRERFANLASALRVPFGILDFDVDTETLRARIARRMAQGTDPSDADLSVLEHQIAHRDPLTDDERQRVVTLGNLREFGRRQGWE